MRSPPWRTDLPAHPEFDQIYTAGALDALLDATAGQPFLTQAVAFELVQYLNEGQRREATPAGSPCRCWSAGCAPRASHVGYNGAMAKKRPTPAPYVQPYRYPSPNIPLAAIRRFARQIAEQFRPEQIILFGSYAYGTPHNESDVDLLVIMPASNEISKSARITLAFDPPFPLDLIVRTPKHVERGLKEGDWFLREIIGKGKVLYEAPNRAVGTQGRTAAVTPTPPPAPRRTPPRAPAAATSPPAPWRRR